ncbi:hypothetical protein XcvCFBP7113P_02900 [Xanthomonas citri pv. vignicola]|nr:hypothetical protein XcvCFBP7113P_02900 [Xanthomonas citri pv. vignicola]
MAQACPPFCTSHADDAAARMRRHERQRTRRWIAAAMCARAQSVAAGDTGTVRRQAPAQYGHRAPALWPASVSLRWSIPAVEEIIARPLNTVSPCVLPRHL